MNIEVDKIAVDIDVIVPDAVVVEASAVAPSGIVTEAVAELPTQVIVISHEEIPTISPLEIIDYGSSSIECAFDVTTQQAEEVVRGVLCGTTNPPTFENADYRLLHGQGSMDLAFAGLHNNTEYYLRPYALSNLGYKYGDVVAQRTKNNPIPDEYQLVEYLESTGTQWLSYFYAGSGYSGIKVVCGKTDNSPNDTVIVGRNNPNAPMILYYNSRLWSIYKSGVGTAGTGIVVDKDLHTFEINYKNNGESRIDGNLDYSITFKTQAIAVGLFCRYVTNNFDYQRPSKIYSAFFSSGETEEAKLYSVYRKSDNKTGMYDIVNNVFYTNAGSGEFIVGPDREWQEE